MQIDLKGWGVGYLSSFQQYCVRQMLNSVAGKFIFFFTFTQQFSYRMVPLPYVINSSWFLLCTFLFLSISQLKGLGVEVASFWNFSFLLWERTPDVSLAAHP